MTLLNTDILDRILGKPDAAHFWESRSKAWKALAKRQRECFRLVTRHVQLSEDWRTNFLEEQLRAARFKNVLADIAGYVCGGAGSQRAPECVCQSCVARRALAGEPR